MWKPGEDIKRHYLIEKKKRQTLSFFLDFILPFFFLLVSLGIISCRTGHRVGFLLNRDRIISTACYCPSLSLGSMDGLSLQMGCEYVTYKWEGLHTHIFSEIVTETKFFWVGKDIWLQTLWRLQANEWKAFLIELTFSPVYLVSVASYTMISPFSSKHDWVGVSLFDSSRYWQYFSIVHRKWNYY